MRFLRANNVRPYGYCMGACRGRRCGVAQRSMPQWGIEPHERASSAGWRPSFWPPSADAPWLPLRGAPAVAGEGWAQEHGQPPGHPSVTCGDTAYAAGPLCRCATSPHVVGSHPSRGAILYTHKLASTRGGPMTSIGPYRMEVEGFWPRRGQTERKQKALRNVQHSCTF